MDGLAVAELAVIAPAPAVPLTVSRDAASRIARRCDRCEDENFDADFHRGGPVLAGGCDRGKP